MLHRGRSLPSLHGIAWLQAVPQILRERNPVVSAEMQRSLKGTRDDVIDDTCKEYIDHDIRAIDDLLDPQVQQAAANSCAYKLTDPQARDFYLSATESDILSRLSIHHFPPVVFSTPPPEGYTEPTRIDGLVDLTLREELSKWPQPFQVVRA